MIHTHLDDKGEVVYTTIDGGTEQVIGKRKREMTKHDRRYLHTWEAYKKAVNNEEFEMKLIEAMQRMGAKRVRCARCGKKLSLKIAVAFQGNVYHSVCGMKEYERFVYKQFEKGELLPA